MTPAIDELTAVVARVAGSTRRSYGRAPTLREHLDFYEAAVLRWALEGSRGFVAPAAEALGIDPRHMRRRMRVCGVRWQDHRGPNREKRRARARAGRGGA